MEARTTRAIKTTGSAGYEAHEGARSSLLTVLLRGQGRIHWMDAVCVSDVVLRFRIENCLQSMGLRQLKPKASIRIDPGMDLYMVKE